ncbi:MAG TPA: DUF6152 family protein [Steroidobacteraceae bacterium]|nr:DUF6152 family protein [Steroidobacteraceae bacterium]
MKNLSRFCAVLALTVLGSATAQAHHSGGMFDFTKCQTVSGTVRKLEWVYPHSWLWIDVANADGSADAWGFEFMSPVQAMGMDKRWKRDVVAVGDKVSVKFAPHREGKKVGALSKLILPDGYALPATPGLCGSPPPAAESGGK